MLIYFNQSEAIIWGGFQFPAQC